VVGLLIALSATSLSGQHRPSGLYLWLVSGVAALVSVAAIVGAVWGWMS